jgi:hypothetical protein
MRDNPMTMTGRERIRRYLQRHDGTAAQVAAGARVKLQTVTAYLAELERAGFVSKVPRPAGRAMYQWNVERQPPVARLRACAGCKERDRTLAKVAGILADNGLPDVDARVVAGLAVREAIAANEAVNAL